MADQLWPVEVHEAAVKAHAAARNVPFPNAKDERAVDAVLAALSVHAVPRAMLFDLAKQWEDDENAELRASGRPYSPESPLVLARELRELAGEEH